MIKTNKKSIYQCPVDKSHTIKKEAGEKVICPQCHVEMKEVVKGIITK